jgi:hypothetical protein
MFPNGQLAEENEGKDRMLTGDDPEPGVLVQEEEGSDTHPKKSEAFDIEFSFRIRISPRKRNRP